MVSAKQGNRRRGSGKQGNNKRFKPATPNSNGFINNRAINAAMFNISQMPDNPGYVDFNEPSPSIQQINSANSMNNSGGGGSNNSGTGGGGGGGKITGKGRYRRSGNGAKQRNNQNNNNTGSGNRNFNGNTGMTGGGNRRNGQRNNSGPPMLPTRNFRNSFMPPRMGGPMGPPMICGPPMPPPPAPIMNGARFGPRPFIPLPPLVGPMGPLRPLPMRGGPMPSRNRRSLRNGPPLSGTGTNSANGGGNGSMRRGRNLGNRKNMKNRKRGVGASDGGSVRNAKGKKSTPTKKTLKEIVNQYSLEKPWVTEEIKAEAKIKEDIENRLKGKKDDQLFAEFKVQRDKFVTMYEAAKKEYSENNKKQKDIAKTLTESDKTNSKQDTISNETVKAAAAT